MRKRNYMASEKLLRLELPYDLVTITFSLQSIYIFTLQSKLYQ